MFSKSCPEFAIQSYKVGSQLDYTLATRRWTLLCEIVLACRAVWKGARACRVERGAATADTVWRLKRATLGRRKYGQKALLRATVLNVEALVPRKNGTIP